MDQKLCYKFNGRHNAIEQSWAAEPKRHHRNLRLWTNILAESTRKDTAPLLSPQRKYSSQDCLGCVEHRLKVDFVTKTTWYRFEFESILVFEPSQKRCIPIKRILFPIDQTYSGSTGSIFLLWECIGLFRSCFYGDTDGAWTKKTLKNLIKNNDWKLYFERHHFLQCHQRVLNDIDRQPSMVLRFGLWEVNLLRFGLWGSESVFDPIAVLVEPSINAKTLALGLKQFP